MQITYTGPGDALFLAFLNTNTGGADLDIVSLSPTQLVLRNPSNGVVTTFSGIGLPTTPGEVTGGNPPGLITGWRVATAANDTLATVSGISWDAGDLILAVNQLIDLGNPAPFRALLSLQPVTLDASGSTSGTRDILFDGVTSPITIVMSPGPDTVQGGAGNDTITVTANTGDGDAILSSGGSDRITFVAGSSPDSWMDLVYEDATGPVTVTLNGMANPGTVAKAGAGTDTLLGLENILDANGASLQVWGSRGNDIFNVNAGSGSWVMIAGGEGADRYNLTLAGEVRLLFSGSWGRDATQGVVANLATGNILNDGFGNAETLTVTAGSGYLSLVLTDNADSVTGSTRDEVFILNGGNDTLNGGGGFDTVRFDRSGSSSAVIGDLATGVFTGAWRGTAFSKSIANVDMVRGTSFGDTIRGSALGDRMDGKAGNDLLEGRDGADTLRGEDGNDTLSGGTGDDVLSGGTGADSMDGGDGWDVLDYDEGPVPAGIRVDFTGNGSGTVVDWSGATDRFTGIEEIRGSFRNDTIVAADGDQVLRGEDGDDSLFGGAGADNLQGGQGGDLLAGGADDDYLQPGSGADTIDGGAGWDVLSYLHDQGPAGAGIRATFAGSGSGTVVDFDGNTDRFSGIEAIRGTRYADTLTGAAGDDELRGEDGSDLISGNAGDDRLLPGAGRDTIDGGAGHDRLSYDEDTATGGVRVLFAGAGAGQVTVWSSDIQQFSNIEEVGGTRFGDTMVGSAGSETLVGNDGDDVVFGAQGDDDLIGEAGNDQLVGGLGNDYLEGGDGNDTLDGAADSTGFGDFMRPGLGSNTIIGSAVLYQTARDGIDISYSDVSGVGGLTILVGANGFGTTRSGVAGRVNDTFSWAQFFMGSQDADRITVTGSSGDWYEGFAGFAGADTIDGGTGYDEVDYRSEAREHRSTAQGIVADMGAGTVRDSYGDTDRLSNIEAIRGTHLADRVTAAATAGAWLNFRGYAGADTLTGSAAGFERADYSRDADDGGTAGIVADLVAGTIRDGFGAIDSVSQINAVRGTAQGDQMFGGAGGEQLQGEAGNDTLVGNAGNDTLEGGDGTDTLNAGTGDDFIFGGSSEADLRDVIYGGDGNDNADGGYGNDEVNGGNGNDTVNGGFGSDTVVGNDGNDVVGGGAGGDVMFGNAGNDTLNGGFGFDRMNGGAGADSFFHLGVADHGSDWIQDYAAAEGDLLLTGIAGAQRSQFQVNIAFTAGAGSAAVAEAFVIYRPTGQVLFALVDGAGQAEINMQIGGQVYDLFA